MGMIFWFSFKSGAQSHSQSEFVKKLLERILNKAGVKLSGKIYGIFSPFVPGRITEEIFVRKTAHFSEYFIFGAVCSMASLYWRRIPFIRVLPLLLGPFAALNDEMVIQRYLTVGRTSAIKDVLLDSIGFYTAAAVVFFAAIILFILKFIFRRMIS